MLLTIVTVTTVNQPDQLTTLMVLPLGTGVRSNMYTSTGAQNSSAYHSSAFEPSAETMPRQGVENPTPEHTPLFNDDC